MANPLRLLSHSPEAVPAVIASLPPSEELETFAPRRLPVAAHVPDIDLDSLRCFDAVATTLRFRSAAARVHLSPGAFSDRIGRLESVLGTRILQRTTRRVALTDAGERLLPVARSILRLVDHMPGAAKEDAAPPRFAQAVGLAFAVVGLVGFLLGADLVGLVATGFALAAALLNAVFGFCLGCEMYLLLKRLTGPRVVPVGSTD